MTPRALARRGTRAERVNRRLWNRQSAEYDRRHARALGQAKGLSWGLWRVPERTLRLLGPVRGRRTLELGCGAARWSIGLAKRGARAVGIDLSEEQLAVARRLTRAAHVRLSLFHGTVHSLPFRSGTFDLAFSDWGGLTFADPRLSIREAGRVVRPGGRLVFATSSPFRSVVQSRTSSGMGRRLRFPYFGLHEIRYPNEINFQLTYGDWVDLFRESGFVVDRLVETPTPSRSHSSYLTRREEAFGRSWPLESIWVLRRLELPFDPHSRSGSKPDLGRTRPPK